MHQVVQPTKGEHYLKKKLRNARPGAMMERQRYFPSSSFSPSTLSFLQLTVFLPGHQKRRQNEVLVKCHMIVQLLEPTIKCVFVICCKRFKRTPSNGGGGAMTFVHWSRNHQFRRTRKFLRCWLVGQHGYCGRRGRRYIRGQLLT